MIIAIQPRALYIQMMHHLCLRINGRDFGQLIGQEVYHVPPPPSAAPCASFPSLSLPTNAPAPTRYCATCGSCVSKTKFVSNNLSAPADPVVVPVSSSSSPPCLMMMIRINQGPRQETRCSGGKIAQSKVIAGWHAKGIPGTQLKTGGLAGKG